MTHFKILIINIILADSSTCEELQCKNGYSCSYIFTNGGYVPVCNCDTAIYTYDCGFCRNFRLDLQTNCTKCLNPLLDISKDCTECTSGSNYNILDNCKTCIDKKFSSKNCQQCNMPHMTIESNCTLCEDSYIQLIDECVSKTYSTATIYFGLIFSHVAIVLVLILLFVKHRSKNRYQVLDKEDRESISQPLIVEQKEK